MVGASLARNFSHLVRSSIPTELSRKVQCNSAMALLQKTAELYMQEMFTKALFVSNHAG